MSTTKHGNSDSIRDFARELRRFSIEAREGVKRLHYKVEALGATDWKDQNYVTYKDQLNESLKLIHRTLESFENEQYQRLLKVAQQYDDVTY